jgi:acetyl-CoA acyltransferase
MHPVEYGAQTLRGVLDRLPGLDPAVIDDVIVGCAVPEKWTGFNVARLIAQRTSLPDSVPGQTLTRFCSSGLQAIATAANAIKAGEMDVVVAGGIERMTGLFMGHPEEYQDKELVEQCPATYMAMGMTAENVAVRCQISRIDMERMAAASHQKAAAAQAAGWARPASWRWNDGPL